MKKIYNMLGKIVLTQATLALLTRHAKLGIGYFAKKWDRLHCELSKSSYYGEKYE